MEQAQSLGQEVHFDPRVADAALDQAQARPVSLGGDDRRASALGPDDFERAQAVVQIAGAPVQRDPPLGNAQRAVLGGIGREFVDGEAERRRQTGRQDHGRRRKLYGFAALDQIGLQLVARDAVEAPPRQS